MVWLTIGGRWGKPGISPGGGPPFWYGGYPSGGSSPGLGNPCGNATPGVGGLPFGWPLGVVGLLPGVPGLSPAKLSLCLRDGVDLDDEDMFDGGRSLRLRSVADPTLSRCSPFKPIGRGGSSSLPTSTTRSPSLLSPASSSWNKHLGRH